MSSIDSVLDDSASAFDVDADITNEFVDVRDEWAELTQSQ